MFRILIGLIVGWMGKLGPSQEVDYIRDIKPLFDRHCVKCHNGLNAESGLRLDRGAALELGGDHGKLIVPGDPAQSRILAILRGADGEVDRMPPEGKPLSDREVSLLERWIQLGCPLPASERDLSLRSSHWSFQPIVFPKLDPNVTDSRASSVIDDLIQSRLLRVNLQASMEAEPATLLRRVSLDLTGLLPTPDEIVAFETSEFPNAYEREVDRLLASPAYGERWGRHWLDLARYADSNGFTRDFERMMWKYRDWVIRATNEGMTFDRFTLEQYAGDLLPDATLDQKVATGFHRNTLSNDEGGTDPEQFRIDAIADRVDTTGVVYLGLTLGCARCHQHKYDPISQRDYYQLFAFLNDCEEPLIDAPSPSEIRDGTVDRRDAIRKQIALKEKVLEEQKEAFTAKQIEWEGTITHAFYRSLNAATQTAIETPREKRDEAQKKIMIELFKGTEIARTTFPVVKEIADLQASSPVIPTAMVLQKREEPRRTRIHRRGNFLDEGDAVSSRTPAVLPPMKVNSPTPSRIDLANWLVDSENPLTPRVVMNRSWQHFFGRGIVETENDFGSQGSLPSHPELLDYLASEWIRSGWDLKKMHRAIVLSSTYRQSSHSRKDIAEIDPQNKLLARQSRIRLDAEIIRDCGLVASGLLVKTIGGPSVKPPQPDGVYAFTQDIKPWNAESGANRYRRGMYTFIWRSSPYPALAVFDAPDYNNACTRRILSNTPLQSLTLANDRQFLEFAVALAREVTVVQDLTEEEKLVWMFRRCFSREPTSLERIRVLHLLETQKKAYLHDSKDAEALIRILDDPRPAGEEVGLLAAWAAVARVLMNLDEFITRE